MAHNMHSILYRIDHINLYSLAITLPMRATNIMGSLQATSDLRILATSDVHMHITGWDALRDDVYTDRGMDMLANCIKDARRTAPGACLLLDNGDALQGTPVGTTCANWPVDATHPWPAVLNALDYDAVGLGNHDFDFGVPFLESTVAQTRAPTLCASFTRGEIAGVTPTTILRRTLACSDGTKRDIKIGVTSVLPPQTSVWNHRHLSKRIRLEAGKIAAKHAVATLKAEGSDLVVVLCHSGLSADGKDDEENFAATLARDVSGIDALVMGHTHQLFPLPDGPQDVNNIPAVMPGFAAEALGVIDLCLSWDGHHWQVTQHNVALHRTCRTGTPRSDITKLAAPAVAETNASLNVELAQTNTGFHSYFNMLQSGLTCALMARTMTRRIGAHVAGTALSDLPLIASVPPVALGGRAGPRNFVEVAPNAIRARHIAMLAPNPNTIWAVTMQGADLWRWAERGASYFSPQDSVLSHLANPNVPSYNFDILHGLDAVIDPFGSAMFDPVGRVIDANARRVHSLTYQGQPVAPDQKFLMALTSYRGAGGGGFPGLPSDPHVLRTDIDLLTALCEDVANGPLPSIPTPSAFSFADAGGKRVLIETSPHAGAHLDDIARFDPQVIDVNAAGFLELSVAL